MQRYKKMSAFTDTILLFFTTGKNYLTEKTLFTPDIGS